MVKSRYSLIFFLALLFSSAPFLVLAYTAFTESKPDGHIFQRVFGVIAVIISICGPFIYFKRTPRVRLENEYIDFTNSFRRVRYTWASVREVTFSRSEYFKIFVLGTWVEASVIVFETGQKLILWEDLYSNLAELRKLISEKVEQKISDPKPRINTNNLQSITGKKYSGNPYFSLNTLISLGVPVFLYVLFRNHMEDTPMLSLGVCVILFLVNGFEMNYFVIDQGYLFIRNHYFPWKNISVNIGDILLVAMDQPLRRSICLRILTNDFKSRFYGAGSLRNKDWNDLKRDLRYIGIPERNDAA